MMDSIGPIIGIITGLVMGSVLSKLFVRAKDEGWLLKLAYSLLAIYVLSVPLVYSIEMGVFGKEFPALGRDACLESQDFIKKISLGGPFMVPIALVDLVTYGHGFLWDCPAEGKYLELYKNKYS
jgi:hypothetical protein